MFSDKLLNMGRGMKQYLPFSSLVEQATSLEEMSKKRQKIEKPQVSLEQASKINRILTTYKGQELTMKIYLDGVIYDYSGKIKVYPSKKTFRIRTYEIPLRNIIDIDSPFDFFDTY